MARRGRGEQGPSGLTTANLLASYGVDVFASRAERDDRPGATRGFRSMTNRYGQCRRSGSSTPCCRALYSDTDPTTSAREDRAFFEFAPTSKEYGYPKRNAFRQPVFEQQLRDYFCTHAVNKTHSEAWFSTELIDFRQGPDVIHLVLRRADGSFDRDLHFLSDRVRWRAQFHPRKKLGIKLSGSTFGERWLILDLEETRDHTRDTKVFCNPARPCLSLPGPDRTRRFEFMLHEGENGAGGNLYRIHEQIAEAGMAKRTPRSAAAACIHFMRVLADRWRERAPFSGRRRPRIFRLHSLGKG